jgi:hypothetical protein
MKLDSTWKKGVWNMLSRLKNICRGKGNGNKGKSKIGRGNRNVEEKDTK